MKMYIAVLDLVPNGMVPTLVAHSVLNAHRAFTKLKDFSEIEDNDQDDYNEIYKFPEYVDWFEHSFRKVTLRVNQKEFNKISLIPNTWLGHESTTLDGAKSCAIPLPCNDFERPNVLKFAKMWAPDVSELEKEIIAWKQLYAENEGPDAVYENGKIVYVY